MKSTVNPGRSTAPGARPPGARPNLAEDFYTGLVADLYTPLKSTSFDADRYRDLIVRHGEPALELGCGDGDPLLDLRARRLDIDGIDSSPEMIGRLHVRATERGLTVDAWVDSMQAMRPRRHYRTIFLAGPTFNLLPDDDAMAQALAGIARALSPDGTAVVPLFEPEPVSQPGTTVSRETPDGSLSCRTVAAARDPLERTQTLTLRYERVTSDDVETVERDWVLHWIDVEAFTELAAGTGLRVVAAPAVIGPEPADVVLRPASEG